MDLPILLSTNNRFLFLIVQILLFTFVYVPLNRYQIFTPVTVKKTWIDHQIKLKPWAIWIYLSIYPVLMGAFWTMQGIQELNRFLYAFSFLLIFSGLIFLFLPTTINRDTINTNGFSSQFLTKFRQWDKPYNCLPSLHVSSAIFFVLVCSISNPKVFYAASVWALALVWSTLATKQHYGWDIIAGIAAGLATFCLFYL